MRRIAVLNQKGGVGKTTTAANLSASLAKLGRRVLVVDLDPQANLSMHLGISAETVEHSVYELMLGDCAPFQTVKDTVIEGLEVVPATIELAGFEVEMAAVEGRESLLREAIQPLLKDYDFVFVDCPPSLGLLTINALVAVREVLIALQTQFFALQGVSRLLQTCELVRERLNPQLKVTGVLACMYDPRTSLSRQVLEDIQGFFGDQVFETVIRNNVRLAEAPGFGQPIFLYDDKCYGTQDYMSLAREMLGTPPPKPPPLPTATGAQEEEEVLALRPDHETADEESEGAPQPAAYEEPPPLASEEQSWGQPEPEQAPESEDSNPPTDEEAAPEEAPASEEDTGGPAW